MKTVDKKLGAVLLTKIGDDGFIVGHVDGTVSVNRIAPSDESSMEVYNFHERPHKFVTAHSRDADPLGPDTDWLPLLSFKITTYRFAPEGEASAYYWEIDIGFNSAAMAWAVIGEPHCIVEKPPDRWIHVAERMEYNDPVLLVIEEQFGAVGVRRTICTGYYDHARRNWQIQFGVGKFGDIDHGVVTHWRPLPKMPKHKPLA